MKVAIVHDWITCPGGAETVIKEMLEVFPQAHIYTSIYNEDVMGGYFGDTPIYTSFINKKPFAKRKHSIYLNYMPKAFESFDLNGYDVVISSSTSCAKGVITDANTLHICYCNTPMRYAWDMYFDYMAGVNPIAKGYIKRSLHKIRIWDVVSANRVDYFIANSHNIARRIKKHYRRGSYVIYPPVDTSIGMEKGISDEGYYLVLSRLVKYKRIDLAVLAFNKLNKPLVVAGEGPELDNLKAIANPNIKFVGRISDEEKIDYFRRCRAFVFPGEEDFGITPVEAQAFGKPVIAYGKGGALETVIDGKTGVFFYDQDADNLADAVDRLEGLEFNPEAIRENALKFDKGAFKKQLEDFVMDKYRIFNTEEW